MTRTLSMMNHIQGIGMTSQRTRDRLVDRLRAEGIENERVLEVIRTTPRHLFIDEALAHRAYEDTALPIGHGQTISQPYIVARMTEIIVENGIPEKVLEVGTGSGYQAAVLAEMGMTVYTIEIIPELANRAAGVLAELDYDVQPRTSDGYEGWPEEAPFDAIIVTAAPDHVPQPLVEQLDDGGVLVIPVGPIGALQTLWRFTKDAGGDLLAESLAPVTFVPLTREE